ncbi:unnamed protein product [Choristocarpus tenellus]
MNWLHCVLFCCGGFLAAKSYGHSFSQGSESGLRNQSIVGGSGAYTFSATYMKKFTAGAAGCNSWRTGFHPWRGYGFGSEINVMLTNWVNGAVSAGLENMAVIEGKKLNLISCKRRIERVDQDTMGSVVQYIGNRSSESMVNPSGLRCFFKPTAHLCMFLTFEEYVSFLKEKGAPAMRLEEVYKPERFYPVSEERAAIPWEERVEPGEIEAREALVSHLWNHLQPWVIEDTQAILDGMPRGIREGPVVALHIRRGDKVKQHEALKTETKVYLQMAFDYLNATAGIEAPDLQPSECCGRQMPRPSEVKGIYVASDDWHVVEEVRELAPLYFESASDIVYISDGVEGMMDFPKLEKIPTGTHCQTYLSILYFLVDLHQLAAAALFVGTFSSNIGRLVFLMRSHCAAISVEERTRYWRPG